MNVLVVNCGSSSLKFQLINSDTEAVAAKGLCERIGIDGRLVYQPAGGEKEITRSSDADPYRGDPDGTGCTCKSEDRRIKKLGRGRGDRTPCTARRFQDHTVRYH